MTEDNPYYDGLGQYEVAYATSFIVLIEAVWYCKSLDKKYIRYSHLKSPMTLYSRKLTVIEPISAEIMIRLLGIMNGKDS